MEKRAHIFFAGMVQGVGFRFTAKSLALGYSLKGWVKNLADRRVELMVQGEPEKITAFLQDLENSFKSKITDQDLSWLEPSAELGSFTIKF